MQLPRVSVIIPFYNVEKYIKDCLDSVLNQTLKEIEIICVDDGSQDNTSKIVDEYIRKSEKIKLIRKENGGQSSARNAALKIASGKYVYFLDSDDFILPTTLEEVYKKAENEQLDIVFFNTDSIFETEELKNEFKNFEKTYIRMGDYSDVCAGQEMFAKMHKNREFYIPVWMHLFRRDLIEDNHLEFYEGIIHEDILFTFQCFMLAKRVGNIDKCYHRRRIREGSTMTKQKSMKNVEGYVVSYTEILRFLCEQKIEESVNVQVLEFVHGIYRNGCNNLQLVKKNNVNEIVLKGNFYVEHFFDVMRRQCAEQEKQRKEVEQLRRKIDEIKSSKSYRVGKVLMYVPGKIKKIIRKILDLNKKGVYYWNNIPNVGDALNEYILKEIFGLKIRRCNFAEADLICIGSIMDRLVNSDVLCKEDKKIQEKANKNKVINVWGTGLIRPYDKGHKLIRPCRFYSLRGELTRQSLSEIQGENISCVLADPGLLASLLVEPQEKIYSVGIIPHFSQAGDELFSKMKENYENAVLIDVKAEPHDVLKLISQCEVIISTSLHGLIIADSFGIPNLWCECEKSIYGGEYKFKDYYSSYGLEAVSYKLNENSYPDLESVKAKYKVSHMDVKKKQKELVDNFPYNIPLKNWLLIDRRIKALK